MTIPEQNDTQIPKWDQGVLEIISNVPGGQKLLDASHLDTSTNLAVISASGGYSQESGSFTGWITYVGGRRIRFQSTKFTTRMLRFFGAGGFVNYALPLERLAGQTGTFSMSGSKEVSALVLWLGNEPVCVPLLLVGEGGAGHLAEGEVVFHAAD